MADGLFDPNAVPAAWFDENATPQGWFDAGLADSPPPQALTATRFDNTNTFYAATVSLAGGSQTLTPSRFDNSQTFYSSRVARGTLVYLPLELDGQGIALDGQQLSLGVFFEEWQLYQNARFNNTNTFYGPTVTLGSGTQTLTPARFDNSQTFYSPTVTTGAVVLTPARFDSAQTFYSHIVGVSGGPQFILPDRFDNAQTFYSPTVTPGAATISPARFDNAQTFYSAVITGGQQASVKPKRGGGKRNYLIQGKKFYLADWELQLLLQQLMPKRSEVQIVEKEDVKQISRKLWKRLRETDSALDALTFEQVDSVVQAATIEYEKHDEYDEDEDLVMLLL